MTGRVGRRSAAGRLKIRNLIQDIQASSRYSLCALIELAANNLDHSNRMIAAGIQELHFCLMNGFSATNLMEDKKNSPTKFEIQFELSATNSEAGQCIGAECAGEREREIHINGD